MPGDSAAQDGPAPQTEAFYTHVIATMSEAGVPFLIGGGYALQHYTGVERHTKDLDFLVRPSDRQRAFDALSAAGYCIEGVFHWVGKVYCGPDCADVIWSTTSGVATIDDGWFAHAVRAEVLGLSVDLAPAEELLWAKVFVMERERYDGADVAHMLRAVGPDLDWRRLLARLDTHWPVLLGHLILYAFIYPSERAHVPAWVMQELLERQQRVASAPPAADRICRGPLLSWRQYLTDIEQRGYQDARITEGFMTAAEVERWEEAFRDA